MPRGACFWEGSAIHVLFDGGSQKGLGTAGFIIIDTSGKEVVRVGVQLRQGCTNNEPEATVLLLAL